MALDAKTAERLSKLLQKYRRQKRALEAIMDELCQLTNTTRMTTALTRAHETNEHLRPPDQSGRAAGGPRGLVTKTIVRPPAR